MNERRDNDRSRELIGAGADIAGGIAGAAIGIVVAGPAGALAGAAGGPAAAHTLRKVATELARRVLGRREEVRVGATIAYAATKIEANLNDGLCLRDDDFFDDSTRDRSAAEEIAEGVVLAAQREHEERKIPFYGNLLANVAFDRDIGRAKADVLIRIAERLSFRQLCLLAYLARIDRYAPEDESAAVSWLLAEDVKVELDELFAWRLTAARGDDVPLMSPRFLTLNETGALLHDLMELSEIETEEIDALAESFGLWPPPRAQGGPSKSQ